MKQYIQCNVPIVFTPTFFFFFLTIVPTPSQYQLVLFAACALSH